MAYNKSKNVEAAQKLLNQGKVAQAIAEYQNILKFEPRDQVTLMTIGELYIRQGETFQAIDYFERLAQIFVGDGFLTKAIAVYKRIAKLAPEEIRPLEKLADLYVQQGVMSEARPLFLQLAELHLKSNRQPEAIGLLKKLLQAEPDNLRIQVRLADLYQAMGQTREAIEAYVSASQRALARGDQAESEKLADKALKLEPNNLAAVIVRARSYSTQGDLKKAAQLLEGVPNLEKGGEQTELLLDLYIKNSSWDQATTLAMRVFEADQKNFGPLQKLVELLLQAGQDERVLGLLEQSRLPMIDAGEHEAVARMLQELSTAMPDRLEPYEWLVELFGRTSDSFRLPDALANYGDALVVHHQNEQAKKIFEQLVERQPDSDSAKRKLNGVLRKMGLLEGEAVPEIAEEETLQAQIPKAAEPKLRSDVSDFTPGVEAKPPVAPAASFEPQLDDETQKFIAQSLTDVDLFASYGLTQKAIGLLEAILRRAPRHTPTLEKLLDFVLGAGDDRRTAELAAQLEQIHTDNGDKRSAERFGELRRRFQRAAGLSDADLAAATPAAQPVAKSVVEEGPAEIPEIAAVPAAPPEPVAIPEPPPPPPPPPAPKAEPAPVEVAVAPAEAEVQEVDLSAEWDSLSEEAAPAQETAPPPPAAKPSKPAAPPARPAAPAHVEEFQIAEEPALAPVEEEAKAAPSIPVEPEPVPEVPKAAPAPPKAKEKPKEKPAPPAAKKPPAPVEPEFELDQEYELVLEQEPLVPAYDQKPPEKPIAVPPPPPPAPAQPAAQNKAAQPPAASGFDSDQFLADLAQEIDQLGMDSLSPTFSSAAPATPPPSATKPAAPSPTESGPLKEVFEEFRAELGEMGAEDEDLETHYNLGIAFREMGLLEEAISEFQKVAKANDRGRAFRYTMQCCTLLGLAFMEKGQPGIAAIWYDRALQTPGIDPESILALRYDLGVAQESAGEPVAALKSFSQVYAMNIDYRDVAERIAALQKPIR
ncbi:MAG TPA: tetratricopeptide repeat protein [Candidatus Angelobacter sp.]|nr:tetratricopeptide repeat protein [Candidatus Angelobacter sp.]